MPKGVKLAKKRIINTLIVSGNEAFTNVMPTVNASDHLWAIIARNMSKISPLDVATPNAKPAKTPCMPIAVRTT